MVWGKLPFLVIFSCFFSISAYSAEILKFDPEPKGLNYRMGRLALEDKIAPAEKALQRSIPFATSRFDINNDGVPELFVKLLEETFFCDSTGCDTYVLSINSQGPEKIASFRGTEIELFNLNQDEVFDLRVKQAGNKNILTYIWQDNSYILVEDE